MSTTKKNLSQMNINELACPISYGPSFRAYAVIAIIPKEIEER